MAFWALGKVKTLTGKLNIKDVSDRLKEYVVTLKIYNRHQIKKKINKNLRHSNRLFLINN